MQMIIGGAFQGKLAYAKKQYPELTWADGSCCSYEELLVCGGIYHFHEFVRREMEAGHEVESLAERLITDKQELVVVTNELGYGVVPIDAFDRSFREATGRICIRLAAASERVCRVVCGIGQVIKG